MMLKWGKVFLLLVWLLSNQAEWLRCVFHHRMLTFISIRNSSEPAASQPASGATFEMQIFDQNSYSFLRVAVPLLLPPTTCLRQSRRLSVVWGKAFTSDSSSAQTCCSCPRTTVPESFISAKPAITDVSSHLKLKRWFFIIIIIIISMLGTSGKWNNKVHKKKNTLLSHRLWARQRLKTLHSAYVQHISADSAVKHTEARFNSAV